VLLLQAYDKHLEQLTETAARVCNALREAGIDYRVVGGLAVFFHVQSRDPLAARLTKDVDLAIRRADLPRIAEAVRGLGLEHRHVRGVDLLVDSIAPKVRSGVHLLFAGEKVRSTDLEPIPALSDPGVDDQGRLDHAGNRSFILGTFAGSLAASPRRRSSSYRQQLVRLRLPRR
jgi:hypothetical protein